MADDKTETTDQQQQIDELTAEVADLTAARDDAIMRASKAESELDAIRNPPKPPEPTPEQKQIAELTAQLEAMTADRDRLLFDLAEARKGLDNAIDALDAATTEQTRLTDMLVPLKQARLEALAEVQRVRDLAVKAIEALKAINPA